VEQHGSPRAAPSVDLPQQSTSDTRPAIDWTIAQQYFGDGPEVLREFSELLKSQSPLLLADIRRSIETRDSRLLQRAAHTMKGSVTYFGAEPLAQAAADLENLGRNESFQGARQMLVILEQELTRVVAALDVGPPNPTS
jgi:HPt (histidine-containing phosphotransfer) domain-containing protein